MIASAFVVLASTSIGNWRNVSAVNSCKRLPARAFKSSVWSNVEIKVSKRFLARSILRSVALRTPQRNVTS